MCERDRDGDRDQGPSKTSTLVPPSSRSLIGWWVVCGWLQSPLQQRSAYMGRAAYNSPVDLDWEKLLRSCNRCAFTYTRLSLSLSLSPALPSYNVHASEYLSAWKAVRTCVPMHRRLRLSVLVAKHSDGLLHPAYSSSTSSLSFLL